MRNTITVLLLTTEKKIFKNFFKRFLLLYSSVYLLFRKKTKNIYLCNYLFDTGLASLKNNDGFLKFNMI